MKSIFTRSRTRPFRSTVTSRAKLLLLAGAFLAGCSSAEQKTPAAQSPVATPAPQTQTLPTTLEEAVNNTTFRSPQNKERDQYRHPLETLTFFGIKPDMTVVEVSPGSGWYTEILAPYLAAKGHYIAASSPNGEGNESKVALWMTAHPDVAAKITSTVFKLPNETKIAPPDSADLVVTFRNVHNWMGKNNEKKAFAAFFKALKPGGTLGVVEHRGNPKKKQDPDASSGYVRERDGFKLAEKSEINANPKDTKDYPEGVWTLPPTYRLEQKDHDRYQAIGESDRMTLRFVKPESSSQKK